MGKIFGLGGGDRLAIIVSRCGTHHREERKDSKATNQQKRGGKKRRRGREDSGSVIRDELIKRGGERERDGRHAGGLRGSPERPTSSQRAQQPVLGTNLRRADGELTRRHLTVRDEPPMPIGRGWPGRRPFLITATILILQISRRGPSLRSSFKPGREKREKREEEREDRKRSKK